MRSSEDGVFADDGCVCTATLMSEGRIGSKRYIKLKKVPTSNHEKTGEGASKEEVPLPL